jgi:hypothetical protein
MEFVCYIGDGGRRCVGKVVSKTRTRATLHPLEVNLDVFQSSFYPFSEKLPQGVLDIRESEIKSVLLSQIICDVTVLHVNVFTKNRIIYFKGMSGIYYIK